MRGLIPHRQSLRVHLVPAKSPTARLFISYIVFQSHINVRQRKKAIYIYIYKWARVGSGCSYVSSRADPQGHIQAIHHVCNYLSTSLVVSNHNFFLSFFLSSPLLLTNKQAMPLWRHHLSILPPSFILSSLVYPLLHLRCLMTTLSSFFLFIKKVFELSFSKWWFTLFSCLYGTT